LFDKEAIRMADERMPYQIIVDMVAARASLSDAEILSELAAFPPMPDENDPAWEQEDTWQEARRYVALSDIAASRRLKPAIRLLMDRACYGDPGEMFRGLRHAFEGIVNPNWSELTDICLDASRSSRRGTRLWAIDQLTVLEDERARPVFEDSIRSDPEEIRWRSEVGIERLDKKLKNT
jgi:hypothetical protein